MAFLKVIALASVAAVGLTGCSHVSYLVQAGMGQLSLYNHEQPLQQVIDDERTPNDLRERLKWVPEIKQLVEKELGIEATKNYTTYVDLKRPYVIWSLTTAAAYRLELTQWKFPIVGSFPYLGFFKEEMAKNWKAEYEKRGYDTHLRGVTAYSTIGYLRDPLLSSMLSRNKADLVNLIFHESTHGVIYLKGQGAFNEQIASYIGDYGERNWIEKTLGKKSKEFERWENDRADRKRFGILLRSFADELKNFYQTSENYDAVRRENEKKVHFQDFADRLQKEKWRGVGYARAAKIITNNAALLAFLTYEDDQDLFELLDKKCGGRLKDALHYLKSFAGEWDALSAKASGDSKTKPTPQSVLYDRLLNAGSVVCLDLKLE